MDDVVVTARGDLGTLTEKLILAVSFGAPESSLSEQAVNASAVARMNRLDEIFIVCILC